MPIESVLVRASGVAQMCACALPTLTFSCSIFPPPPFRRSQGSAYRVLSAPAEAQGGRHPETGVSLILVVNSGESPSFCLLCAASHSSGTRLEPSPVPVCAYWLPLANGPPPSPLPPLFSCPPHVVRASGFSTRWCCNSTVSSGTNTATLPGSCSPRTNCAGATISLGK